MMKLRLEKVDFKINNIGGILCILFHVTLPAKIVGFPCIQANRKRAIIGREEMLWN